jgi:hypothetical protein
MPKRSASDDKTPSKRSRRSSATEEEVQVVEQEEQSQAAKSATKRNSPLWDHFTMKEDWTPGIKAGKRESYRPAVCKYCDAIQTRVDGNTTNMRNHLKKHPSKWQAYLKAMKQDQEEKVSHWNQI